ncbi:outer membrane beta-barrel protein [Caminibacter sp.]
MKKFLLGIVTALTMASASQIGHCSYTYAGIAVTPQEKFSVGSEDVKTKPLLGFTTGFMKVFSNNIIAGAGLEVAFGKLKDYSDRVSSGSVKLNLGYRFDTDSFPIDVYGIAGYRFSRIGDTDAHGAGYGAGVSVIINGWMPTVEYTHYKLKDSGVDIDDDRATFSINFVSF